jgi:hypothetical protein
MTHAIAPPTGQPAACATTPISAIEQRLLAERVRQCVPLRHPAFGKLLQLLSIEATDTVPTAAVTVGARSRMLINPAFVAQRCRTDAHLSMLVMHELYHVLLGHTRMYQRPTLAANWAFDCIINAQLCRLHPTAEFTSFFSACAAPEGPWSLIGPPAGWPTAARYAPGALGDVHRRLYDDAGATTTDLFALLDQMAVTLDVDVAGTDRLLGNHDQDAEAEGPEGGDPLQSDPDLIAEVRRIVARWPMVERREGADDGGASTSERSSLRRHGAARRAVRELLRAAAFGTNGGPWVRSPVETEVFTPLPQAGDRRAHLQRLMGAEPLWWQGHLMQEGRQLAGQVAVYLDVSGSMAAWLPVLLDALTESAALVQWPLFGFSTEVHPVTRTDLAAGRFRSTGGTHIGCVARHLIASQVKRAVVITDGDVQAIPTALAERLRRTRPHVRVGLLDGCNGRFCASLGWPVTPVPALDR